MSDSFTDQARKPWAGEDQPFITITNPFQLPPTTEKRKMASNDNKLDELYAALAKAQGEFRPIVRDREVTVRMKSGGTYTFRYAPTDTILDAIRPALAANGLALTQMIRDGILRTVIAHAGGACIEAGQVPLVFPEGATEQEKGSKLTYMQRYSLQVALVLSSEDDDDGNAAAGNHAEFRDVRPAAAPKPPVAPAPIPVAPAPTAEKSSVVPPSGPVAPAPAAPTAPCTGDLNPVVSGKVLNVSRKEGNHGGKPWVRWSVNVNGDWFATFDAKLGDKLAALRKDDEVTLEYRLDSGFRTVLSVLDYGPVAATQAPMEPAAPGDADDDKLPF